MPWFVAAAYGLVSGLGLAAGAFAGWALHMRHRTVSATTAIGAGLLIAAASLYLLSNALAAVPPAVAAAGTLIGAGTFSAFNLLLARWAADKRKRCGECVGQPREVQLAGSGLAIAFGSMLDAVPESLIIGATASVRGTELPPIALVAAFALGNFAEGLSSTSGMRAAGRSARYVTLVWLGAMAVTVAAAVLGLALFSGRGVERGWLEAVAAGALIALVIETMAPEAVIGDAGFRGLLAVLGFSALLLALTA